MVRTLYGTFRFAKTLRFLLSPAEMINTIGSGIGIRIFPIIGIGFLEITDIGIGIGIGFFENANIGIGIGIGFFETATIGIGIGIGFFENANIGIGIGIGFLDNTNIGIGVGIGFLKTQILVLILVLEFLT